MKKKEEVIKNKVFEIFLEIFPEDLKKSSIKNSVSQSNFPSWDSFAHMEIVSQIESKFNISLSMDETVAIESMKDVLSVIGKKLDEK